MHVCVCVINVPIPIEVVPGVLDDRSIAVGFVPTVRDVHIELSRPGHETMTNILWHSLVLIQLA